MCIKQDEVHISNAIISISINMFQIYIAYCFDLTFVPIPMQRVVRSTR